MKKIGIITIIDNDNYGNRLQNYAVQSFLEKLGTFPTTIKNKGRTNKIENKLKSELKKIKNIMYSLKISDTKRLNKFKKFNKNIRITRKLYTPNDNLDHKYDYFICGSDQIWKPTYERGRDMDFLNFAQDKKRISFSASFGISELPDLNKKFYKKSLEKFNYISVREDAGKKIVEDLTNRSDVEVLVDPTMLLTADEWDKVAKKPEQLKTDRYILNYFLGELSEKRKCEINRIAKENDCEVINILDKNSSFYCTGPSEFLYLERNAFLICTDSFHSSVFAILYNRPFVVFNREGKTVSMNSRIETLINKFKLKNREYNEKNITKENLNHDYTEAYKILEDERKKSENFLKKALDLEEEKKDEK